MRILIYICLLLLPSLLFSQNTVLEKVQEYVDNKQYNKADNLIANTLDKTTDEDLRTAMWYYKGKGKTQEYFESANSIEEDDVAYRNRSYLLLEGIAAFQNVVKRKNLLYSDMALRQIGGLHRFLKEMAFSYLHEQNYERFYLNLDWARNCDRFVQQYLGKTADYQMDTMLIYLVAYAAELTNRSFEAKAFYETLLLEGLDEEQMFIDHYNMLQALNEPSRAERILEQALLKFPESANLVKYKLHWLMTNEHYEETIRLINEKQPLLPEQEAARLYFVKGMAWNARYEAALKLKMNADSYFKEAEQAYKEAVMLSPTTFDYAYNLAALYYNKVVLIQPDSLPEATDQENYALFIQRAAETLESTLDLNSGDRKVINALEDIYRRTNQTEKLRQLQQPKG